MMHHNDRVVEIKNRDLYGLDFRQKVQDQTKQLGTITQRLEHTERAVCSEETTRQLVENADCSITAVTCTVPIKTEFL